MRGRRAQPDAVKALKGNPGKRRLLLEGDKSASAADRLAASAATAMPEYLSGEREREIFRRVVDDYLQRRVARPADLNAYARWAHYLHRWILCKEALDGQTTFFKSESKWGTMFRRHPLFKDLLDLERVMQSLEDRLGLNPVARQNIIRGLAAVPAPLGGLFGEEPPKPKEEKAPDVKEIEAPLAPDLDPVGFLTRAAAKHIN